MTKLFLEIIAVALCLVTFLLFYTGKVWFLYPDSNLYPVKGIDVSHHQNEINWKEVSGSGIQFAYIKATEANDFVDSRFQTNWEGARKNGLNTGAYHFYSFAYPGKIQAENFTSFVPTSTDQLPPAIDLEYVGNSKVRPSKEEFQKDLNDFIVVISAHFNQEPILYTTYDFYEDYLYPEFSQYRVWIRSVYSKPKDDNWYIWQYNPKGRIPGISGPVDLNVFSDQSL